MGNKIEYHCYETCNNCGSRNKVTKIDTEDNIIHECDTECTCCGFKDHWAHGFFQSVIDGYDKCKKYTV